MRWLVLFTLLAFPTGLPAEEPAYRLFAWERGIGLHPRDQPEMKVYLWFYEWNMFGAVSPAQHSRGDWENEVEVADDGLSATIVCAPHFKLEARVDEGGAELILQAANRSEGAWPELAGIIACFNPGPEEIRNAQFANENTSFRAPEGLLRLERREIHWNDRLRAAVDAEAGDGGGYAWSEKWPKAEPNATGGLLVRESADGKWRMGIAWDRFLSCQRHNPWQCMHLGIHLGPLAAGEAREVRGRIYLVEESDEQVLDRYERDFPRPDESSNARRPQTESDVLRWIGNMMIDHRFSMAEAIAATGLSEGEIDAALVKVRANRKAAPASTETLRVLPYPGGRHPRIGFLEGAVRPQRETKLSVFTPWDSGSYVVADVPEAVWWHREAPETEDRGGRELLYLAHTHVPTHWSRQGIDLEPLEWQAGDDGSFTMRRLLPNKVELGTVVRPRADHVEMEQWITNGTEDTLTGLRVQNCVMLKGAPEFAAQDNANKSLENPYAVCRDAAGRRWVITAWEHCLRSWGNARCPCLHSDPQFPDCPPGETMRIRGWLSFYEGEDIEAELERIEATGWRG